MKINLDILMNLKTLAMSSSHPKVFIASALVHRNKIISFGLNSMKSHSFQKRYSKNEHAIFLHAEVAAIHAAKKLKFDRFENSILYVARMKYNDTTKSSIISGLAAPCDGCIRCIQDHGIKTVIYTLDDIPGIKNAYTIIEI